MLLGIIEMLEPSIHPVVIPLVARDTVNRGAAVGHSFRLVLDMLHEIEEQVGVQDRPEEGDIVERYRRICETCMLSDKDCWRGDSGRSHAEVQADKEHALVLIQEGRARRP